MSAPILIFGAHGGIGEALARRLAASGENLVLSTRNAERGAAIAAELNVEHAVADTLDESAVAAAVHTAAAHGFGIKGLAYCVGSIVLKPLPRISPADMAEAFALNVIGAAMAVKHAIPALKRAKGSVVLFSTVAARQGFSNHAVIGTAKAAVEGLTLSLATELAPDIRVNCIAPSLTNTPLASTLLGNPQMSDAIAKMHPIPRLGEADDHAALAAFLLSEEASWITGQIIGVDGGRSTLRVKG